MIFDSYWSKSGSLSSNGCGCSIAGAGLTTQHQGRRINHPQATDDVGKFSPNSNQTGSVRLIFTCLGPWVGSQRKRSRCASLCRRWFAATRSALSHYDIGKLPVIYSFLIAPQSLRVAELNRIRIVSCYARNLEQARASFAGLPVALLSRKPARGKPA